MIQDTRSPRTPLPPVERHRRSRETLIGKIFAAMLEGESLADVTRREHMPRHATVRRWLASDAALRRRYHVALVLQTHLLADDMVAAADRLAVGTRGRRRIAAVKRQIAARKLWIKVCAAGVLPRNSEHGTSRGLSPEDVATLEAAWSHAPHDAPAETTAETGESATGDDDSAGADHGDTRTNDAPPHDERTRDDDARIRGDTHDESPGDKPPKHPPPTPFVPRWFNDDDLHRPERPYDPFDW